MSTVLNKAGPNTAGGRAAVLVLGDYQQSVVVVRSMACAGYRVIVGQSAQRAASALSRHAHETWPHPEVSDTPHFLGALRQLLDARPDLGCIFPVGEADLIALLGAHEALARRVRLAMPAPAAVEACLDKPSSYRIAAELGVPLPAGQRADGPASLDALIGSFGLPLVFKCPDSSRLIDGRKALICRQRAELERWREPLRRSCPLLVQRWMPGARHNCHFAAAEGQLTAFFQQCVLRTDQPDDTGFGVEGVSVAPSPDLQRHVAALVQRLAYHGVGCAQFLVDDATGAHVFLELNPRLDATCELPYVCGFDFPQLALDPRQAAARDYPAGRRFHWLLGDARSVMRQVREGDAGRSGLGRALARMLAAHFRAHLRLTWDWRDPLPTLYLYGQLARAGGRRTLRAARLAGRTGAQ